MAATGCTAIDTNWMPKAPWDKKSELVESQYDTPERMALPAQELVDLYFRNEQKRMARADGGRYTLHDAVIAYLVARGA